MGRKSVRSIFPRIESLYITSRMLMTVAITAWMVFESVSGSERIAVIILIAALLSQTIHFYVYAVRLGKSYERLFIASLIFDIVFISFLTHFTGGIHSNFYLLYYMTVAFGAYFMGPQPGMIISFVVTTVYSLMISQRSDEIPIVDLLVRCAFAWSLVYIVGVVSKHMKLFESKLLKLLDTLNVRTTELERMQVQIENIYDTSLTLGEILNPRQLLDEINRMADTLWGYALFEQILVNPETGVLELCARIKHGNREILDPPVPVRTDGVVGRVANTGISERIVDVRTCSYYIESLEDARSEMAVPMISRGRVVGVLNVESKDVGRLTGRDQELVSILASSAAMAVDNARLHSQISELAVIDELTGVYNYRYFAERLGEERRRSERYELPLSLIMVDIDWFKKTNDTYGHEVGNAILRELVGVIKECIRDTDRLCRYGGEEFIVILPQTSSPDALIIGQRIRERVDIHEFGGYAGTPKLHVTVSVGITSYPDNGLETAELISAVDSALYHAKGSGKNQVCSV
ncbi:MAG: sensor domain-containing diguanylate cyclase [Candidatus Zixiibacteriota bacterium]